MTIKKVLLLTLTAIALGIGSAANAACTKYGKVEQVYQNASYAYIYIKPLTSVSTSTYHYCYTNDRDLIIAAHAAKDGNGYVRLYGDVSSCPTAGSLRACVTITRY